MTLDYDYLDGDYNIKVNGESYMGDLVVGDTLEINKISYAVLGINEDGIVVKEIK